MNYREYFKELLPVIQAWVGGKEIQFSIPDRNDEVWNDYKGCDTAEMPAFNSYLYKWRVKPEKIVMYGNCYMDDCIVYTTKELANSRASSGRIACVRIEFQPGQYDQ